MLHYWGQFTDELPEPWAQDGGHVWREAGDYEALVLDRDALLSAVRERSPMPRSRPTPRVEPTSASPTGDA